jgi:hypothetical protein
MEFLFLLPQQLQWILRAILPILPIHGDLNLMVEAVFLMGQLLLARVLSFEVNGDTKITVSTTSNGAERTLNVAAGSTANIIKAVTAPSGSLNTESVFYYGDASTIFIYSESGGINLYEVIAESTAGDQDPEPEPEPVGGRTHLLYCT